MTPEELKKFCAYDDDCRFCLQEPFSLGEYTYATNGHIMVRVPRIQLEDAERSKEAAKHYGERVERMFSERRPKDRLQVPHVELLPPVECEWCGGSGQDPKCHECKGTGEIEFSNSWSDYEAQCKTCNGGGHFTGLCDWCDGTGKKEVLQRMAVGSGYYQSKYLALLATLPNCWISPDGENTAPFGFYGGEGLLMPCSEL